MTTYTAKIQIVKPLDTDWNTLGKILNELQYETWKFSNKAMQMLWEFDGIGYEYFNKYKKYLNLKEYPFIKDDGKKITTIDSHINNQLKELVKHMNSAGVQATIKNVIDKWKADKKDVQYGRKSVANYKRDLPIELHNKQMFTHDKKPNITIDSRGKYIIEIKLISQKYAMELGRKGTETGFKLLLAVKGNYLKSIVDRVISGEYKLSMSKIVRDKRKKKWFLNLAYTFTPKKKQLNPNRIMGIDMGVNIPAMLAISDSPYYRQAVGSKEEVESFRRQIEARRRSIQRQRKWCGEGSIGHGVKTRLKPLEKLSGKIARFKDTKNHCWSRYIINEAIKNNCGTIQMEDLTGIAKDKAFLKNWTYDDLRQKITYKAEEAGIKVVIIDPYKTSSRCHKCGHIHSSKNKDDWRPKQEKFICESCGFKTNADWNAAKNIATKGIEKIIKKQMEKQDQEYKHGLKYVVN